MPRKVIVIINVSLPRIQVHAAMLPQLTAAMDGINKRRVSRSRAGDHTSKKRRLSMEAAVNTEDRFTQEKGAQIWMR